MSQDKCGLLAAGSVSSISKHFRTSLSNRLNTASDIGEGLRC